MPARSIVEHFDVIEDIGAGLVDPFLDAGFETMVLAEAAPGIAAVLRALIGMDQGLLRVTAPDSHQDGIEHELPRQRRFR